MTRQQFARDLWEAKVQVAWFTRELRNHKYNSVADAKEKLDTWKQRQDGLERRIKQLEESFLIYEENV